MSVKWGVLGTADIARGCTIPGMKLAENCELYAVAGRNEAKVNAFCEDFGFVKGYVGYEKLLEDPEVQAVYIPLPNSLHKEWVIKALDAGKHVLCEKPLALNAGEAKEMFDAAKKNGVHLMEAFAYLHSPYVPSLKADLQSGIIGEADYIGTAFIGQGYVRDDIRLHKELGGGAVYDLGCYCTSMILSLYDEMPDEVIAKAEFTDLDVDLFTSALLKFPGGKRASFEVGMIFLPGSYGRMDRLYIHGSKGYIRSGVEYNQAGELTYEIVSGKETITRTVSAKQNYSLEVSQLGRCIENGETPYVTADFSIREASVLDMILKEIGY